MCASDVFRLAFDALWQQKSRTVMTTLGVLFGSFVLAASLSIGQGVQDTIHRESHRSDYLRRVVVSPQARAAESGSADALPLPGEMSDDKRARLRRSVAVAAAVALTPPPPR